LFNSIEVLTPQEFEEHDALEAALTLKSARPRCFIGVSGTVPNLVEQIEMVSSTPSRSHIRHSSARHKEIISRARAAAAGIIIRGRVARGAPGDWQRTYYMLPGKHSARALGKDV
jgi:hypothetical protein